MSHLPDTTERTADHETVGAHEKKLHLEPVTSFAHGEVSHPDDARNGEFKRSFTKRQIHIISLGSNIGSGLFIAIGKALADGGPGFMVIAYFLVCSCVWAVLQSLSEMTIAFPVSGSVIDYVGRWVDPALAFGLGFAEWLGWTAIVGAEAVFFTVLVNYWAEDAIPQAALRKEPPYRAWSGIADVDNGAVTIFLAAVMMIFSMPNTVFAWFEYFTSLIKLFLFLLIIAISIALLRGAGPNGYVHDASTWTELPAFKNGFGGFANCALLAIWAVGDQIFIGVMGGEAESPRMSMGHATKLVPYRVIGIYMTSIILVTFLVRSDNSRLLGGTGAATSPFVISLADAGVQGLPDVLNAGMIFGVLAIAAEAVYLSSRVLRTMAHQKLIPEVMAKVDDMGRPRWALIITLVVAITLTYLNLSAGGTVAFNWLVSITSSSFFVCWIILAYTSFRFRAALKAQNDPLLDEPFAWRSSRWPLAPTWLMMNSLLLLASCVAAGVTPLNGGGFETENFLQYMIGIIVIVGSTTAYKVVMRTEWRNPHTADCITGRKRLSADEISALEAYYKTPAWRRFCGYIRLW